MVANETRRDKKAFFSGQCKEIEENNEWKSLEISSRKLEIPGIQGTPDEFTYVKHCTKY